MNKYKKAEKTDKTIRVLGGVLTVLMIVMIAALCFPESIPKGEFTPPAFEDSALQGIPEVDECLAYQEVYRDGMAYRLYVCCVPAISGNELTVYFTSADTNEKYLKLRVLDEKGNMLGESGLLKAGEYVRTVTLSKELSTDTKIELKVMGYEPEDYSSAGSISINVTAKENKP